ncbi:MAG TPA: iron-sulfur cluster assembly scaffold protein, partial [Novosphingobium sp.]|nr:iron-sulfur cluster assembly scaffold protein [Novosphingobium sp.]
MASVAALYTPEVLGLATSLAQWPLGTDLPLLGRARSASCGSVIDIGLALDGEGRIAALGLAAQACAVGQAAAALFATHATGRNAQDIAAAEAALARWLAGEAPLPDWPGLAAIAAAQGYPGRHGAVLLAWRA